VLLGDVKGVVGTSSGRTKRLPLEEAENKVKKFVKSKAFPGNRFFSYTSTTLGEGGSAVNEGRKEGVPVTNRGFP
jgi:hypothetical protein